MPAPGTGAPAKSSLILSARLSRVTPPCTYQRVSGSWAAAGEADSAAATSPVPSRILMVVSMVRSSEAEEGARLQEQRVELGHGGDVRRSEVAGRIGLVEGLFRIEEESEAAGDPDLDAALDHRAGGVVHPKVRRQRVMGRPDRLQGNAAADIGRYHA